MLKRDGRFSTQDAAKIAGREDAKKMKNMRQPERPDVGHFWWDKIENADSLSLGLVR